MLRLILRVLVLLLLPSVLLAADLQGQGHFDILLPGGFSALRPKPAHDKDFYEEGKPNPAKVELGKLLFFDKISSGNLNTACVTCHHPLTASGYGLSLPVGEGGVGLGVTRNTGSEGSEISERVPRNSPPIFNRGTLSFDNMFHDRRVEVDPSAPSGFRSPAGDRLPLGLDNVLAVQAMFPVTSPTEMAGHAGENPVADAAALGQLSGPEGVWELPAQRLRQNSEYVELFKAAFSDIETPEDITFTDAANAIAAFQAVAFRADNSPFDRYLHGDRLAMGIAQYRGMALFYGKARCYTCHSGTFQTDQGFHAIAMPQAGPGKGDGEFGCEDFGRERVTGDPADRYKSKTPSLRNVALTGPWGHGGAFGSLKAVVMHHLSPMESLQDYDPGQVRLPSSPALDAADSRVLQDVDVMVGLAAANEMEPVNLTSREVDDLIDFLHALTDPAALELGVLVPKRVPSGLPLYEKWCCRSGAVGTRKLVGRHGSR